MHASVKFSMALTKQKITRPMESTANMIRHKHKEMKTFINKR